MQAAWRLDEPFLKRFLISAAPHSACLASLINVRTHARAFYQDNAGGGKVASKATQRIGQGAALPYHNSSISKLKLLHFVVLLLYTAGHGRHGHSIPFTSFAPPATDQIHAVQKGCPGSLLQWTDPAAAFLYDCVMFKLDAPCGMLCKSLFPTTT